MHSRAGADCGERQRTWTTDTRHARKDASTDCGRAKAIVGQNLDLVIIGMVDQLIFIAPFFGTETPALATKSRRRSEIALSFASAPRKRVAGARNGALFSAKCDGKVNAARRAALPPQMRS